MCLYSIETFGQLHPFLQREWLLTNGLGGYAFSTVIGCNTRKYHGLLIGATKPPVGRINTLSHMGEMLILDGDASRPHELSVNVFRDTIHPHGEQYLRRFELGDLARWTYEVDGVRVVKEVLLLWMRNAVGIRYTIEPPGHEVEFRAWPFFAMRDFHGTRHANGYDLPNETSERAVMVSADQYSLQVRSESGDFVREPAWWYGQVYPVAAERGQDSTEDLFTPGRFTWKFRESATLTLWASLDPNSRYNWKEELARRKSALAEATKKYSSSSKSLLKLSSAANDFIVARKTPDGSDGTTIIAGYPWFADWGRDTCIALPGLLLATGRFDKAKQVLTVFASYVSEGMIPNRFDDYTNEPEYNTVDASLWFIHACFEYGRLSGDQQAFEQILKPACRKIIEGYQAGTRFNIHMDPSDGLITQGDATTQLTWMDAKTNNVVFTPRDGKAVEINALWYHGLVLMGQQALADKVAASFRDAFWISPFRGLADVVRGARDDYQRDTSIRPNQVFAASLPNTPLSRDQQHAVVEVVRRELLTPFGLRTLSPTDPKFCPHYAGPQFDRDRAYHNGTIWPWLIGGFLDAYLRVNDRSEEAVAQARRWLSPLVDQLDDSCLGQLAEIYEAQEPHRSVGCPAQAWSIAEVLRLAVELGM
jgi:predicted glycogen debranching enzyme